MSSFTMPKGRILFLMSLVYLSSFSSLYVQLPGLFSRNGILPVDKLPQSPVDKPLDFLTNPNVLRLAHHIQLDQYDALELVTLLGVLLSLLATLFSTFRTLSTFIVLWLCHFACCQVGQVFLHFQWDQLLLEAGFLMILLAGADLLFVIPLPKNLASDRLAIFMCKWLLFRLMFASGVVKLTSECPAWWNLQALNYHFETQCLPTPLAYWAHALPEWVLKLGVVFTFYAEIILPALFFLPLRCLRKYCFYTQVLLQVGIMLTGNYNFFNLMTIALCYSLLTDCDFSGALRPKVDYEAPAKKNSKDKKKQGQKQQQPAKCVSSGGSCKWGCLLSLMIIVASLGVTVLLFRLELRGNTLHSEVGFDKASFQKLLTHFTLYTCYAALLLFVVVFYLSLRDALRCPNAGFLYRIYQVLYLLVIASIAAPIMFASTTEFALGIQPTVAKSLPTPFHKIRAQLDPLHITSHYGLFRRMTTKRNELVLEYADSEKGPWEQVRFYHKPGPENGLPTMVTPHQPRLDWQMWFAALLPPSAEQPAWLYSLLHRLLSGQSEVQQLVKWTGKQQPKFMRASLYQFQLASKSLATRPFLHWPANDQFWTTKRISDYLPVCSLNTPLLKEKLTKAGLWGASKPSQPSRNAILVPLMRDLRNRIGQPANLYPLLIVVFLILLTKCFLNRRK